MAKVYVKLDENNIIIEINSNIFLEDVTDYIQIDEGNGDKFAHAQSNYLEKGLYDEQGRYNYKLVKNKPVELSEEEKAALFPVHEPVPSEAERLDALEAAMLEMILGGAE